MGIVCFGEALIDFKATGSLAFQGFVGGSPLNISVAAARLGAEVALATCISEDMFGDAIFRHLLSNGVSTALLLRDRAPSTLAFVEEKHGDAHFSFLGEGAADSRYNPQPRPHLPEATKLISFGSISLFREPTASAIFDMVAAHKQQATILFDPNIRPALIEARDSYEALLLRALALCDIVKVSTQDLAWLYPGEENIMAAKRWLEHGPKVIIVTDGGDAVQLLSPALAFSVPIPQVAVQDTVGAGDTFLGALMARLSSLPLAVKDYATFDKATWLHLLRYAASAAALNCTHSGANPPTEHELLSTWPQLANV